MSTLERAIAIAAEAHAGQTDKAGAPYILHPLRVMLRVTSPEARIVAVLHDVVEDCPDWSFARLTMEGFSPDVLAGLAAVTKQEGEPYDMFVRRAGENGLGRAVKMADIQDNLDLSRMAHPTAQDFARLTKYRAALSQLLNEPRTD